MATTVTLTATIGYGGAFPITTVGWSQATGPGTSIIASPLELSTSVELPTVGNPDVWTFDYDIIINGTTYTDTVQVTTRINVAPVVTHGGAYADTFPDTKFLITGTYSDDDLPVAGPVVTTWSLARNPAAFPDTFTHYDKATPDNPASTKTDFTFYVDMSDLTPTWWANVRSDGGDIRVSDSSDVQLAVDVIHFNFSAKTGFLAFRSTKLNTGEEFRIWCGDPSAATEAAASTFGRHNAYASHVDAFYPDGGGTDRTSNARDLTATHGGSGPPTAGDVVGPIGGSLGTAYVRADFQNYQLNGVTGLGGDVPLTLIGWAWSASTDLTQTLVSLSTGSSTVGSSAIQFNTNTKAQFLRGELVGSLGVENAAVTYTASTWEHLTGAFVSTTDYSAWLNGANEGNATVLVRGANVPTRILIGANQFAAQNLDGRASLVAIHAGVTLSEDWITYHATMEDQTTFWNGWTNVADITSTIADVFDLSTDLTIHKTGSFTLSLIGNDGALTHTVTDDITVAAASELGLGYDSTTPDAPGSELTDHTWFVDLGAEMSATWWATVETDGDDIRVTDANDVLIPFYLINWVHGSPGTGVLAFKRTAAVTPVATRIWCGNATLAALADTDPNGQFAVFDSHYKGFYPDGGGNDDTVRQNDLTMVGTPAPTVGGTTAISGFLGTAYDGVDQYGIKQSLDYNSTTNPAIASITGLVEVNASDTLGCYGSLGYSNLYTQDTFKRSFYLVRDVNDKLNTIIFSKQGGNRIALTSGSLADATWSHVAGTLDGTEGDVRLNAGTAGTMVQYSSTGRHDMFALGVRAQLVPVFGFFQGELSAMAVHTIDRSADWISYQHQMLTGQSAFWNTWTWTAA